MSPPGRIGCYPGSFNPPTLAHLALAEAAVSVCRLDRLDLVVSRVALAKEHVDTPHLDDRLAVLRDVVSAHRPWLGLVVSDLQLLADLACGYDVLVMGADKWAQVLDPAFYGGSSRARDAAVARLPEIAVAPRPGSPLEEGARPITCLTLPDHLADASSTAVRQGRAEWVAPEAAAFDRRTGAWSDPDRYAEWRRTVDSGPDS